MFSKRTRFRLGVLGVCSVLALSGNLTGEGGETNRVALERTYDWAPPLTLSPGEIVTAEPRDAGRFRLWDLTRDEQTQMPRFSEVWQEDNYPSRVVVADIDGDGNPGEIVAGIGASLGEDFIVFVNLYREGPEDNSFWDSSYYGENWLLLEQGADFNIYAGNLDDDPADEIVVAAAGQIAVLDYDPADPGLRVRAQTSVAGIQFGPIVLGDLDGDGTNEIVASDGELDAGGTSRVCLRVLRAEAESLSDSGPTCLDPPFYVPHEESPVRYFASSLQIGDVTGDGAPEIWLLAYSSESLEVRLEGFSYNAGSGQFHSVYANPADTPSWDMEFSAAEIALGNLNQSRGQEIAVASWDHWVEIYSWDQARRTLQRQGERYMTNGTVFPYDAEIGDVDPERADGAEIVLGGVAIPDNSNPAGISAPADERWQRVPGGTIQPAASGSFYLEVIQFDAARGQLRSKALRKGGSGPDGDDPGESQVLDLALVPITQESTVSASSLVFPTSIRDGFTPPDQFFVGTAVANLGTENTSLSFEAFGENGNSVATGSLGSLPASGQKAFLTAEVLPSDSASVATLEVHGGEGPVSGFFMVGTFDGTRLDGVGAGPTASTELFLPYARNAAGETTFVFVTNPSETSSAEIQLTISDSSGEPVHTTSFTLSPRGTLAKTLPELGLSGDFEDGYLHLTATQPVGGFAFVQSSDACSALGFQVPATTRKLYAPHYFVSRDGDTQLRILNAGLSEIAVLLTARSDAGIETGSAQFTVGADQLFTRPLSALLGIDPTSFAADEVQTGYLSLEVQDASQEPARLTGALTFSGDGGRWVSTLPLNAAGETDSAFLQVAQSEEFHLFTGLAILNAGVEEAHVQVDAFDERGISTGMAELMIPAGERRVDLLSGPLYFGDGFQQVKGHFRVTSDQPVVAFALFGNDQLQFMSAIEGQAAAD